MTENSLPRLHTPHRTWWKAPLVASLPGVPLLAWEYSLFRADGSTSGFGVFLYWAMGLFALAWALPHRRSLRTLRVVAAGTALAVTLLPVVLAVLLGLAMAA
ncbi:hypothetical protein [Streptomyces aurantiogriseus]|uniref:hypothetical protein n=1 Tax=Streptomyces aurantiogriseus TaxID=66870 RepID=UPI001679BCB4|nr:hypothetical protein [Streptomyces aurantiogriseus]